MDLILFALLAFGASKTPEMVAEKAINGFQKEWDSLQSYQSSFKQVTFSKGLGTRDEAEGMLYVVKPSKMRWESKTDGTLQILNGNKFLNVQENKRRGNHVVDVYKDVKKALDLKPLGFLSGKVKLKDLYNIKYVGEGPASVELKLTPKDRVDETMVAEVDKKSYLLRALTSENTESRVRIDFTDTKTNVPLADSLFDFKLGPKDVVHEQ